MEFIVSPATLVYLFFRCPAAFSHHRSAVAVPLAFDPIARVRTAGWSNQFAGAFTKVVGPATVVLRTVRHPLLALAVPLALVPGSLYREAATLRQSFARVQNYHSSHRICGAIAEHRSAFAVRNVICPVPVILMHSFAPNIHTTAMPIPQPPIA